MKIENMSTEDIRIRMGAEATTAEAERMLAELNRRGDTDTDDISDFTWNALIAECAEGRT